MLPLVRNSKPHLYGFIASLLVLAFGGYVLYGLHTEQRGRDRVSQRFEDIRRHSVLEQGERPAAMERLARIRAELASSAVPEWAGEYSLVDPGGPRCAFGENGRDYSHHEGFALAPESGAVWWYGVGDVPDSPCVDHGEILHADDSMIVVAWTLDERDHHIALRHPWRLLDREIVRVGSGEHKGLIPSSRMPLLCAALGRRWFDDAGYPPMKGGVRVGEAPQLPILDVPPAWREYMLAHPLRSTCEFASVQCVPPQWSWTRFPPWRKLTIEECSYGEGWAFATCSIPLGTRDGLRVGMPMYLPDQTSLAGRISEVGLTDARVEFVGPYSPNDSELRSGDRISTELSDN